ncbi:MAG: LCP family protein [Clostridia bacterium]|nr:LCP family protein [Clostridia bacterium]
MASGSYHHDRHGSALLNRASAGRSKADVQKEKPPFRFRLSVRIIAAIGAALLFFTGAGAVAGSAYIGGMLGLIRYDDGSGAYDDLPMLPGDIDDGSITNVIKNPTPVRITSVQTRGNTDTITNIMLIGIDGRNGENYQARSDTNMILSINTATGTVKLASLLRDVWVTVPGLDFDEDGEDDYCKLNAAFYYGGFKLLSETIEQNFHLKIDQYIAVDFEAFSKAVDALGGVDVELSEAEAQFIPEESDDPDRFATSDNPDLSPLGYEAGVYHLNGQQALAYCRIRYLYDNNDFTRQENQRRVIDQLMTKAKTMNFATLTGVLVAVLPYVQTNFSKQELLSYASNVVSYIDYDIERDFAIPYSDDSFENAWIGDGLGLWLTDPEQTALLLHQYIYNEN